MKNIVKEFVRAAKGVRRRMRRQYLRKLISACVECCQDPKKGLWLGFFGLGIFGPDAVSIPENGMEIDTTPGGLVITHIGKETVDFHGYEIPTVEIDFNFPNPSF